MAGAVLASLSGVTRIYGEGEAQVNALSDVNLELYSREVVVINGQNLLGQSPEKLATIQRDNIAFVFQFYNLIPTLTAEENVRVIPELTHTSSGRELTERVTESLTAVDLLERSDHFPGQMSGGQQQRVGRCSGC
ncbi:MAG: ATP-binding cassette domain-containing protein [Candidatus Nanopelagicales bacterium]|nr:ATP-binding cassette domain-containing protein [Candidatus Nanopelagicales bacterium]MDZ7577012.1 ATP-binding cassette domain-containing protein [Candidatus Nanopelagicales bacterium]